MEAAPNKPKPRPLDPFRRALVRGLAVLLPPLLTIVILLWAWNTIALYLLEPAEGLARSGLTTIYDHYIVPPSALPENALVDGVPYIDGEPYHVVADGNYVPASHYEYVAAFTRGAMPTTANDLYRVYVDRKWLPRTVVVPVFLCAFLLALYLLGKFLAAGAGRFFWVQFERIITRLPLVKNVYSSVKQVTDFVFSERELEYTRVVAVEYPRKGIWQIAFATGNALSDITAAANEPLMTVFFPCSPMPMTGFMAIVKRADTLDLNITMEQALQLLVSCGVVVPPDEMSRTLENENAALPALPQPTPSPAPPQA